MISHNVVKGQSAKFCVVMEHPRVLLDAVAQGVIVVEIVSRVHVHVRAATESNSLRAHKEVVLCALPALALAQMLLLFDPIFDIFVSRCFWSVPTVDVQRPPQAEAALTASGHKI